MLLINLDLVAQSECATQSSAPPSWIFSATTQSQQSEQQGVYLINIYIHIIRSSNGNGLGSGIATSIISTLNTAYSNTNIQFALMGYEFVNNDYYYNDISSEIKQSQLLSLNSHSNAIDIYVLGTSTQTGGFAGKAADIISTSFIIGGNYYNVSTLPHEMGHCLGLYHTHHGTVTENGDSNQCKELVNGSNAATCGDYIEDTPADPNVWIANSCSYTGTGKDANGQYYNPSPLNIMSYSYKPCRNMFTALQIQRMRSCIQYTSILQNTLATPTILGNNIPYNFQQITYTIANLPTGTSVTWSGSNNVNIISGQGTSQVTISICSGSSATLTATLSGAVNQVLNKTLEVNAGNLSVDEYLDHVDVWLNHPYAQCFDWEISNSLTSIIGNGNINCSNYSSLSFTVLNGTEGGCFAVRARNGNCYSYWHGSDINLWRPQIGVSYLNPMSGEPFSACLVEPVPGTQMSGGVEYYWYIDNHLVDVTTEPCVYSYNWTCGYSTHCYVIAVIDGETEISSNHVDFWGMCTGGGYSSTYSAAYPNPAGNELIIDREETDNTIQTNSLNSEQNIQAKNATVKVLLYSHSTTKLAYSKDFPASAQQIRIDTSQLPDGIYYLNIISNNEKIKEQTIIVKH
ncbi:MAG: zinc-dependent metalloprotease [Prevotellaceae bacterium]|jgi:hypothetical protein|nr:zinc-dependent metalloprotease [Prevotellaceae bacterium]